MPTPQYGAPPSALAPFITYIGYNNLLNSYDAADPTATSGDALLALDNKPFTKWNPSNSGRKSFEVQLAYDQENRLLQSVDLNNAAWTKVNATATATTIVEDSTASVEHYVHQSVSKAAAAEAWTLTAYITAAGRAFAGIRLDDGAGNGYRVDINLTTGALGTPVAIGTGFTLLGSSSVAVGSGWRVRLSVTTNTGASIRSVIQPESALGTVSFNGNGTTSITVTTPQLVKGSAAKPPAGTTTEAKIPPADAQDPISTPELYTADYGAVYAYALQGGTLYLDYFDIDTQAFVNILTFTPDDLTGAPVMKIAGTAVASFAWRVRIDGVPENLLLYSEELDNAAWTKTDTTITANSIAAPDVTVTADLLTEGVAGTALRSQAVTVTAGDSVTHSVYMKRGNHDVVRLAVINGTDIVQAWFNLATGAALTGNASGNGSYQAHSIENAGSGWYRCQVRGIVNTSSTAITCLSHSASADASTTRVNSATRYEWGAQAERSGLIASEYQATTSAAVVLDALLGIVNIGQWLGLPMQQVGWTPARMARRTELNTNVSDSGQFLGRSLIRNGWEFDITGRLIDMDWAYDAWTPFMQHAERLPFFFKWEVDPTDVGDSAFCWVDSKQIDRPTASTPFRVDVSIPVSAIVGID